LTRGSRPIGILFINLLCLHLIFMREISYEFYFHYHNYHFTENIVFSTLFMFLWWNLVPKMTRDILVDPSTPCVIWWHYHDPRPPLRVSRIIWMAPYRKNGLSSSISWTRVMGQMRKTHGSLLESGKILIISTSWYISPSSVTLRRISLTDIWKKDRCYQALIMSLVGPGHC